jgi:tripartite-type tricarboxylate transporter receptor subunit TctC
MAVPLRRPANPRAALHHLRRRRLVGAALAGTLPRTAAAQEGAARPTRVLVGFPGGSMPDLIARLLAEPMAARLGAPLVVENRPGATGAIAAEAAARAAPDGRTLLVMPHSALLLPVTRRGLSFDPDLDFAPVAGLAAAPLVLVTNPALGLRTVDEFVTLARARGEALAYGTSGPGASPHMAMATLARAAGISPTAVAYRGDPEIFTAILSGQVAAAFVLAPTAVPLAREGRLTALAVTAGARLPALPQVPTTAEAGWPDVTITSWWGLVAPRSTPSAEIERLSAAARAATAAPGFGARLAEGGAVVLDLGPAEFGAFIARERARLLRLAAELDLKPE